jgi:iron complex transport system permease protein
MHVNEQETVADIGSLRNSYRRRIAVRAVFIASCAMVCLVVALYSATLGTYPISAGEVYDIIIKAIAGVDQSGSTAAHVVLQLRLPRILGAIICGASLAICGAAMQSMMKNPLADPYTMGISSGAGFGAALAIIFGFEIVAGTGIVLNAFIFAIVPAFVILFLSRIRKATPTMMILCGISLMYVFNAMTQLFMLVSSPDDLSSVYTWMVGSLSSVDWTDLVVITIVTVFGSVYVQYMANQLNLMCIGDDSAKTLGVNVDRQRLVILMVITLVAASVVSFTGIIGFIGLMAPHIVRTLMGADNRFLIPGSAVFGAVLLLLSDIIARTIVAPTMLPVGVVTACLGGPLFMYLILRNSKEVWS